MSTTQLIQSYYDFFNTENWEGMLSLLDENIRHDENQGAAHYGIEKFREFLSHMEDCYQEKLENIVIMVDNSGKYASSKFIVNGKYIKTDRNLPEANGQEYSLEAGTFFELSEGKISRITTFYNLNEWLQLVG